MIWQILLNGLVTGSIYALMALGYTVIYGVARLINFAHGDVATVGAYVFLLVSAATWAGSTGGVVAAVAACIVVALGIERLAYRPAARAHFRLAPVISTLGASAVLQASLALLLGPQSRGYPSTKLTEGIPLGPATVTVAQLLTLLAGVLLTIALFAFLRYTSCGQALRAVADDQELAESVGIAPTRVLQVAFGASGVLAAAAGIASGFDASIRPGMGYAVGFPGFTAAILGGIGNPLGAVLGAYALGISENLAAGYISSEWKAAYAFIVLIVILLFRPQGILGHKRLGAR